MSKTNFNEMENESIGILISVANMAQSNGLLSLDDASIVNQAIKTLSDDLIIELEPTEKKYKKYIFGDSFYKYCAANAVVLILDGKEYRKPNKEELEFFQFELDKNLNCFYFELNQATTDSIKDKIKEKYKNI
jgi:hypothetical protein